MKQIKVIIALFAIAAVFVVRVQAQDVNASITLDTNSMLVGDQIELKLQLTLPENYRVQWPVFVDSLAHNIEVLRQSNIDSTKSNGLLHLQQSLTITVFDSGYYVIPPIRFGYGPNNSITGFVETEPHLINVFTVPVDTNQPFKPLKGPLKAPYTLAELLPWILLVLFAALLGVVGYRYWKKKKAQVPLFSAKPKFIKPPHQLALDALDELKKKKLWQQGRVKEYYTELTEIIRAYIEKRFEIQAIEMTTWEILVSFKSILLEKGLKEDLQNMLELADLVKFAKASPLASEHDQSLAMAENFVIRTIPVRPFEPVVPADSGINSETQELIQQSTAKN